MISSFRMSVVVKLLPVFLLIGSVASALAPSWSILPSVPYNGKQDDIFFSNRNQGWYVNGAGFIYGTQDGGQKWTHQLHQPGTYFRSISFIDDNTGFAGNIGPDYFPGVTDSQPLYRTKNGGLNWEPVKDVAGEDIKGICSIDVLKTNFINAGRLEERTTIYAAGRVGGPAKLIISRDSGASWKKYELMDKTAMIQDVKFLNESTGFLCAGSDPDISKAHAQILKTTDGGTTWKTVYQSSRPLEIIWKCSFPTDKVGYATILSFDASTSEKFIVKTSDGGETWQELPFTSDPTLKEFGIGFLNENEGWVGAQNGTWHTKNGGTTWENQGVGHAINKIRIVKDNSGTSVFGIGVEVMRLDLDETIERK